MNKTSQKYWPIALALTLIIGVLFGYKFSNTGAVEFNNKSTSLGNNSKSLQTFNEVIQYIDQEYVDTVNQQKIIQQTIQNMLQNLDPHSYYIPPAEVQAMNEPLEGNFDGIGVEFNITKDTIIVVNPLSGGPSELVGIQAGDRIITVDGEKVAGIGVTNKMVMDKLRGERGTEVKVEISRTGSKQLIPYTITRDKIPLNSVDIGYMIDDNIGYIKISRFAKNTYTEFMDHSNKMQAKGMNKMILDLRNNGGGYMDAAINICDEFLEQKQLIVYTQGRARSKKEHFATAKGSLHNIPLIILINESSASASEIVAGALQDNDRATIIGRRSFGKGLVQEQSNWPDGSAIRLTIARYYTPSGRCIQKPYDGSIDDYYDDYYDRFESGELVNQDSVKNNDTLEYKTVSGRIVYGGGGIMPDSFVAIDTNTIDQKINNLLYHGKVRKYAFHYVDMTREHLMQAYPDPTRFNRKFKITTSMISQLCDRNNIDQISSSAVGYSLLKNRIKAQIGRYLWSNESFYPILNLEDPVLKKSIETFTVPPR
ncbi:MAG: S41 family peptidase [Flavobacteriales bacterium]|nr:S41 family peptidase [Flavobacteriales bacterium]